MADEIESKDKEIIVHSDETLNVKYNPKVHEVVETDAPDGDKFLYFKAKIDVNARQDS